MVWLTRYSGSATAAGPVDQRSPGHGIAAPPARSPAYASESAGQPLVAQSLAALLAHPRVPREVDERSVQACLEGRLADGDTLLRGVRRIGPHPQLPMLPGSARFLAELGETIRQGEQPLPAGEDVADWLRARRPQVQGVFRSVSFCARPYWDAQAVAAGFFRACGRPTVSMAPFWRLLNVELWLRLFVDRSRDRLDRPLEEGELEELGDGDLRPGAGHPHPGRHLAMVGPDGRAYLRTPIRTRHVWPGEPLPDVVGEGLAASGVPLRAGDVVVVAEKAVAVGQGRVVPLAEVRVRRIARLLAHFVRHTPAGISLHLPESFELAIREVGLLRILAGAAATALGRPLGIRGLFYRCTGWQVAAIDSPDPDALPPSDTCIKLAPREPERVAAELAEAISGPAGVRVEAAVIDVNDIGAEILGASPGVDRSLLVSLLRDNPLGQDTQQTPVGIVGAAAPVRAS